jgi:dCMP deaminase
MSSRWDNHFLHLAQVRAGMSKDPSTRVGAVIVGPDKEERATGFNGFPRGIADLPERLNDRETKLQLVVHAELNAIVQAARVGVSVKECTLYLAATDDSGMVWGGPPCTRCTVHVIQAGIRRVVSRPRKAVPSRWHADLDVAAALLAEAGVAYHEVEP